jgi:hypothetical protein
MRKLMNLFGTMFWVALALVLPLERMAAAAYAPAVTMSIKTPDGFTEELAAHESGLATLKLKNGTEYSFRPTMQDDKGNRITVTIFDSASTELGEVEVGAAKPAVQSKTSPAFTIRITKVDSTS